MQKQVSPDEDRELEALFEKFKRLNDLHVEAMAAEDDYDGCSKAVMADLNAAYKASWERVWAVECRIIETPPKTLRGLAIKAWIFKLAASDAMEEAIINDILTLGGLPESTL